MRGVEVIQVQGQGGLSEISRDTTECVLDVAGVELVLLYGPEAEFQEWGVLQAGGIPGEVAGRVAEGTLQAGKGNFVLGIRVAGEPLLENPEQSGAALLEHADAALERDALGHDTEAVAVVDPPEHPSSYGKPRSLQECA